jgi:hypothetical protein
MRVRTVLFVTAGMIGAAIGGAAISSAITDPDVDVAAVEMPGISVTPGAEGDITVQSVQGLEQLIGTLRAGESPDDWYVSGIEVDVGPDGWISGAPPFADYDSDGTTDPLLTELRRLEGRNVTLGVRYEIDDDQDDADVFTIEGLAFRDPAGGPAPWQTEPVGTEATRDDIAAAAVAAVDQGTATIDVDRTSNDGWSGWDVEVRAADGSASQVHLDLTGNVLDIRPDND